MEEDIKILENLLEEGFEAMCYLEAQAIEHLIKAYKELEEENKTLKQKNSKIKKQIDKIEDRITQIESERKSIENKMKERKFGTFDEYDEIRKLNIEIYYLKQTEYILEEFLKGE